MKITRFKAPEKESNLLGYFSLEYKDTYGMRFINGMKYMRARSGHNFICFPDKSYEQDGVTKYAPYTGYTEREASDKFQVDVMKALDEYFKKNAQQQKSQKIEQLQYPHVNAQVQVKKESSVFEDSNIPF